jgi:hypothetical protein
MAMEAYNLHGTGNSGPLRRVTNRIFVISVEKAFLGNRIAPCSDSQQVGKFGPPFQLSAE